MTEENLFKKIKMNNHQELLVYDKSRKIAADTWFVTLIIRMIIKIDPTIFTGISEMLVGIEDIKKKFGEDIKYEIKIEKNFVNDLEKDSVFNQLLDSFLSTNLPYLSKLPRRHSASSTFCLGVGGIWRRRATLE